MFRAVTFSPFTVFLLIIQSDSNSSINLGFVCLVFKYPERDICLFYLFRHSLFLFLFLFSSYFFSSFSLHVSIYIFLPGLNCVTTTLLGSVGKEEHFVHEHQLSTCLYKYYFESYFLISRSVMGVGRIVIR